MPWIVAEQPFGTPAVAGIWRTQGIRVCPSLQRNFLRPDIFGGPGPVKQGARMNGRANEPQALISGVKAL
jgi:hypothetical protein